MPDRGLSALESLGLIVCGACVVVGVGLLALVAGACASGITEACTAL